MDLYAARDLAMLRALGEIDFDFHDHSTGSIPSSAMGGERISIS